MTFCVGPRSKMLCLWFYLFLTSVTYAQEDEEVVWCIMPPDDVVKNGKFILNTWSVAFETEDDARPAAGTKMYNYVLEFECDPGFFLRGSKDVRCVPSEMGKFPECSDTCDPGDPACSAPIDRISDSLIGSDDLGCGILPGYPSELAGGRQAFPGDVPWQAAIYDKSTSPFMQICGGTIVSKDVVISAAHCFKLPDEFYAVAVGKIYRPYNNPQDVDAQKFEILEIRVPPRYRGSLTSFQDDIAAVILATPIQFTDEVLPVCLHFGADFDEVQVAPGKLGRVAGWGIDSKDGRPSQILNLAEMPMVDIATCFALQDEGFVQYITSDKICAGYNNGTAVCKGDSGGGLAVPHKSGFISQYYLRGVVSTAPPPALANECNVNAVTTFTRLAKHEFFVKSAIAKKPLQDGERRKPPIIPANYISSNQNRLGASGRVPEEVPSNKTGTMANQIPVIGNTNDSQAGGPGTVIVNIPDTLTINDNIKPQNPVRNDPVPQTGNKPDPQRGAPGTVVVIPDILTTDSNRNTQGPLIEGSVQQTGTNEIPEFGNSRDPQAQAPGTVFVIPDILTIDSNRNTQDPIRGNPVIQIGTNERPSFGNSRDPQAQAPGTVLVIPDILTTDSNRNTQRPLTEGSVQQTGTNERPVFGNSRDPQAQAPGTVLVIPDILTIDSNRNTQDPIRGNPVIQTGTNERPPFGISRDPQAQAPGTVVVIPDILTTDSNKNTQRPLTEGSVQQTGTNESSVFGNSRDPQAQAPGTVVVIPDILTTDSNRNTQGPLIEGSVQQIGTNERPVFGGSRDPQAQAPGTVVVIPDILPTDGNRNTQGPLREGSVQQTGTNGIPSFGNSRDPQVQAPGTVVVIPADILTIDSNRNTQDPVRGNPVIQTGNNNKPVFSNNPDPQRDAPGTVVIIPDILTIKDNIKTQHPLREDSVNPSILSDSVKPIDIFGAQKPIGHNHDQNKPPPGTVAIIPQPLLNNRIKTEEKRVEDSFIRNPITGIDNNDIGTIGFNKNKVSIETTHAAIAPSTDIIEVTSDGLTGVTSPSPPVQSAPEFPNYQHWPFQHHKPNYNWHFSNQNGHYSNQNKHQNPHNGYFGHDWHYSHPVWNSHNHQDFHHGNWWRN